MKSNHSPENEPQDVVDRALASLGNQPEEYGPSPDVMQRTLAALKRDGKPRVAGSFNLIQRIITMTFTQRLATAVALTIGGLTLWFAFGILTTFSSVSYGEVAAEIRAAHTMSWVSEVRLANQSAPVTMKSLWMDPGHTRTETFGSVQIMDSAAGKALILTTLNHTAQFLEFQGTKVAAENVEESFRKLADAQGDPIESRRIGDVKAAGFKVNYGGSNALLWADPRTHRPLLVEMTITMAGKAVTVEMKDFTFDPPLDPELFSLTPPPGYAMSSMKMPKISLDVETNVVTLLTLYSQKSHGQFPPSLTDWGAVAKIATVKPGTGEPDEDSLRMMTAIGALTGATYNWVKGTDYDFTPAGINLGDANRIVFWYRKAHTNNYRAVYGDLHAADVKASDLPNRK